MTFASSSSTLGGCFNGAALGHVEHHLEFRFIIERQHLQHHGMQQDQATAIPIDGSIPPINKTVPARLPRGAETASSGE